MKKYLLIATILLTSASLIKAQDNQPGKDRQQRIQAAYVAFVTQRLNLTPDEAQKFWPVHTNFMAEIKAVKQALPELDKQQLVLNIKKRYQTDFAKILGTERTETFFRTNAEFTKKLLEKIKKQRMRTGKGGV